MTVNNVNVYLMRVIAMLSRKMEVVHTLLLYYTVYITLRASYGIALYRPPHFRPLLWKSRDRFQEPEAVPSDVYGWMNAWRCAIHNYSKPYFLSLEKIDWRSARVVE